MSNLQQTHQGKSILLQIDMQDRLVHAMPPELAKPTIHSAHLLLQASALLEIPCIISEQYPEGLGETLSQLKDQAPANTLNITKTKFSAAESPELVKLLDQMPQRRQLILYGLESHICVLQTALNLKQQGFDVFVVSDACLSRDDKNHRNALSRMQAAGIVITNTESVIFEWLQDAKHPNFKVLSKLLVAR